MGEIVYIYELVFKIGCICSDFKNQIFKNVLGFFPRTPLGFAAAKLPPPFKKNLTTTTTTTTTTNKQTNIVPSYGTNIGCGFSMRSNEVTHGKLKTPPKVNRNLNNPFIVAIVDPYDIVF